MGHVARVARELDFVEVIDADEGVFACHGSVIHNYRLDGEYLKTFAGLAIFWLDQNAVGSRDTLALLKCHFCLNFVLIQKLQKIWLIWCKARLWSFGIVSIFLSLFESFLLKLF